MTDTVLLNTDARGVARITMNRPELHNAFDETMIAALTDAFTHVAADPAAHVVLLSGAGKSFCAGADLAWMKRAAGFSRAENIADANRLSAMLHAINACPKPVVGIVQGAAYGGGVGVAAACDILIAGPEAKFCLSEVKLGLIPAVISPFVVQAIGARQARRYFLTAEVFGAWVAKEIGLAHIALEFVNDLEPTALGLIETLLKNGPDAMADAKALIADVADRPISDALRAMTAERIATRRASDEGKDGISAFLDKRKPKWMRDA
jgi:methylglutaconyl-CoA hydratase